MALTEVKKEINNPEASKKETIILKNKKIVITLVDAILTVPDESVSQDDDSAAVTKTKKIKKKTLIIDRAAGNVEIFEEGDDGLIVNPDEIFKNPITLLEHADVQKRGFYKNLLQQKYSEIENFIVLSGAGTSVGVGRLKKGLTMAGLWDALTKSTEKGALDFLIEKVGGYEKQDLEELLSLAAMLEVITKDTQLSEAIRKVKGFIVQECTLLLDDQAPHQAFLNKIGLRPQKFPRVKLFTLNYDTLFEQAAAKERYTVIDGFTFSNPRIFNGKYFDYDIIETRHNRQDKKDSTIAKLFYLFKMHGSLNWKRTGNEIEQASESIPVDERIMIFPQSNKYEHSYEQPYFEMMARFQQALRMENTLLITIGFSFYDKHVSSVILESLKQNPSLNLMSLTHGEVVGQRAEYQKELHRIAEIQSRVTLIAESFSDFTDKFPENIAHKRFDILESLNDQLKNIKVTNEDF